MDAMPDDLRVFLEAGGQLEYDESSCEAGHVVLHSLPMVRERLFRAQTHGTPHESRDPHAGEAGTYAVPGLDLVASCTGDYDPEGLLVWFPVEGRYGVCDTSHDYVLLFPADVRWPDIVESPAAFLNAQWAFEGLSRKPAEFLAPWHHYQWRG